MSVLEADDYQSERELLQPKSYNTFDYSRNTAKKDEYHSKKVSPPPTRSGVNYINVEDEDQMEIYGYTPNLAKTLLTWTLILLTGGLLRLLFHWKPHWMLLCTHNPCSLEYAKKVLLIDHFNQKFTEKVVCLSNDRLSYHNAHGGGGGTPASDPNTSITSAAIDDDPEDHCWITVPRPYGVFEHVSSITYFENKKVRYIWDRAAKEFLKLGGLDREIKCTYFYQQRGLSAEHQRRRQVVYGLNQIVVTVQSVYGILISEVLEPFYIFQIFSLVIWSFDAYYYYASCIVIMSALSLTSSVIQTRRNQKQLRDTVQGTDSVMVYRGGETADTYEKVESSQLVPGDIIEVPSFGCIMQCDAVLISGNVIINEAMLTGESVPVTKTPLPSTTLHMLYDAKEHAKHTLFCGTKVIQTRYYNNVKVRAVIIRTGYQTAKGELVRSIMFPKPVDFKFNRHIHHFIGFLSFLALIGFVYTIILKAYRGVHLTQILLKALDLITIIIPPALPAAMTIGVVFAQSRLRKAEIFCISPRSINISGCINCVCFDKTGTLTEDDLNFSEVVPVAETVGGGPLRLSAAVHHPVTGLEYGPLLISLAVCHSLTLIDGKIIGDPLDQKMFAATEWLLEEPDVNDTTKYDLLAPTVVKPPVDAADKEVGILRQFPFSSSLQRMSVIARQVRGTHFELYAKGAPEMIQSLCDPRSIPADFSSRLAEYTEKGYRVLGLAYRPLASMNYSKVQRAAREDLEKNLTFVGLLVMGNMLKPETTHVIETLLMANIRSVMITGDNMLTALSVARECSMIQPWHKVILLEDGPGPAAPAAAGAGGGDSEGEEAVPTIHWKFANSMQHIPDINFKLASAEDRDRIHIAVTGRTFKVLREHYPELLKKVAVRGTVFARMAPEQKQQLIELLQELGYYVGMCGDGANDCGALKAAHAGVSLSETEASVASPFTSKQPNIGCIPTLIKEGRASIVTAFGILKYMACYSLTQFISVIILYTFYSNLTDKEFLYIDLFLITLFVTLFGRNKAFKQLNRNPPPSSLIGLTPLSSIVLQIGLVLLMQVLAIVIVQRQPWYRPHVTTNQEDLASHDNYALFASSVFQYITLAVVFSKGKPYRQSLYSNKLFLLSLLVMTLITGALVIYPPHFIAHFFELDIKDVPIDFRTLMVLLAAAHFFLANLVEAFVVDYLLFKKIKQWFAFLAPSHLSYEKIEGETRNNTLWLPNPPLNTPTLERTTTSSLSTTTSEGSGQFSNHSRLGGGGGGGDAPHVVLNGSATHHRAHHHHQTGRLGSLEEQATSQFSIV